MLSWTTGMSALGNIGLSTDQVPWSRPHSLRSSPTGGRAMPRLIPSATPGAPGAGYCWSNSACGKPPKSWIVLGLSMPVSHQPRGQPVRRNAKDQLGPGPPLAEFGAQGLPAAPVLVVLDRVHRAAVAQEQHGHAVGLLQAGQSAQIRRCLCVFAHQIAPRQGPARQMTQNPASFHTRLSTLMMFRAGTYRMPAALTDW